MCAQARSRRPSNSGRPPNSQAAWTSLATWAGSWSRQSRSSAVRRRSRLAAEALGGLGGVLGDVPSDLLGRELARLLTVLGDVVDIELLPPAGIPAWPVVQGRARHPHGRDRLLEGLLEQVGRERLRW